MKPAAGTVGELELADVYCRYLTRRHYENFWVTSWLAPPEARRHLERIYAFCRLTDDLGDESGALAEPRLALWREDVERCFAGPTPPVHPALLALGETIRAFDLPKQPFLDLIAANLQDQRVSRYDTWEELRQYCLLSAAPVGRLVLRVFGFASPARDAYSDDVCIGLQLANFAQDVRVDREKGRVYLLQSDIQARGVPGAVEAMCERASRLLQSGHRLEASVNGRVRVQLALYRLGGEAILRAIAAIDYRTDRRRPRVSTPAKFGLLRAVGRLALGRPVHVDTCRAN
ncbi:MAG: squalene/phytoene synthase family protein [Chloroflexi bacterium]|nr:squalene/phytoene synthase family protein [Chloroflexota bacterium]